jgi:hypothetical protein
MFAHSFDPNTGEYLGPVRMQLDPMETRVQKKQVFLMPGNSTSTPPPEIAEGEIAIWTGSSWAVEILPKPEPEPELPIEEPEERIPHPDETLDESKNIETRRQDRIFFEAAERMQKAPKPQTFEEIADTIEDLKTLLGVRWMPIEKIEEPE